MDGIELDEGQGDAVVSLRDTLSASFDAAESGQPAGAAHGAQDDAAAAARARDEQGRFAARQAEAAPVDQQAAPVVEPKPSLTTWRREFVPLQDKLAQGLPLTADEAKKLADYNVQREREYSTGISTYKAEAQQSKAISDVMQEFMPALQQHNMQPAQWIQNMGRAHTALVYGSPEQKLQVFGNLAQAYGVPLGVIAQSQQQGGVDPNTMALLHEINTLKQGVAGVTGWRQQQEDQAMQQEIAKMQDAAKYPHFEQVRGKMAELLQHDMAGGLDDAYQQAVRLVPEVWNAEQQRQAAAAGATQQANRGAAVAKARKAGASVRTGTPAGTGAAPASDLRGSIAAAFEAHGG